MKFSSESAHRAVERADVTLLAPNVYRVDGVERRALRHLEELHRPAVYVAVYEGSSAAAAKAYVGLAGCGQNRPTAPHVAHADQVIVITEASNSIEPMEMQVVERTLHAKLLGLRMTLHNNRRPDSIGVGQARFDALQLFVSCALVHIKSAEWLFGSVSSHVLMSSPAAFEDIVYPLVPDEGAGELLEFNKTGIVARGLWLHDGQGLVILAGSMVRGKLTASAGPIFGARREELVHGGRLKSDSNGNYVVTRPVVFKSRTTAAKFVGGSSGTASDWKPIRPPTKPNLRLVR